MDPAWAAVRIWDRWKTLGALPEPGDLGAQPAAVFEAIDACERELAAINAERQAKTDEDLKRKQEEAARAAEEAKRVR